MDNEILIESFGNNGTVSSKTSFEYKYDKKGQWIEKKEFKNKVISECADIFYNYDSTFVEKLDTRKYLIGFCNGVYDLEEHIFRDGSPDDYVSLSVGHDWIEFSKDHKYILEIEDFFSKVQPNKKMRNYILTLLASYLDGHTKREQFIIWTGKPL